MSPRPVAGGSRLTISSGPPEQLAVPRSSPVSGSVVTHGAGRWLRAQQSREGIYDQAAPTDDFQGNADRRRVGHDDQAATLEPAA